MRCSECHAVSDAQSARPEVVLHAQEILQRWADTDLLDQISSFGQSPVPTELSRSAPSGDEAADDSSSAEKLAQVAPDRDVQSIPTNSTDDVSSQRGNSKDVSPSTPVSPAETAGLVAVDDPKQTKKNNRRHMTRPAMKRRPIRTSPESTTTSQQPSETPEQGMDAVQPKIHVDRPGHPSPASDLISSSEENTAEAPRVPDAPTTQGIRIDGAAGLQELTDSSGRVRGYRRPRRQYIDPPHEATGVRGPHFETSPPPRSSLTSLTGQFLAYAGVLGLTIGTAIVIYGHFGGQAGYTPTGWLVTTVAQMLLFLGVINLVSGGIEQNNEDVSRRIDILGEQLLRIEQAAESAVRGPKIPVERYAGTETTKDMSENEAAADSRR